MKTKPTTPASSFLDLRLPTKWEEMRAEDLEQWAALVTTTSNLVKAQVLFLFLHLPLEGEPFYQGGTLYVRQGGQTFSLAAEELAIATAQLAFLATPPTRAVLLQTSSAIGGRWAYETLGEYPFADYLQAESLYQAYLQTLDTAPLRALREVLCDTEETALTDSQAYLLLLWYSSHKAQMTQDYPHLFCPTDTHTTAPDLRSAINAQIRALTGGDITKEPQVAATPTWRALTELNEKAREAAEMARQATK